MNLQSWGSKLEVYRKEAEDRYLHKGNLTQFENILLRICFSLRAAIRVDILSKTAALSSTVVFSLVLLLATLLAFLSDFSGLQTERATAAGSLSSVIYFILVLVLFQTIKLALNSIWNSNEARYLFAEPRVNIDLWKMEEKVTGDFLMVPESKMRPEGAVRIAAIFDEAREMVKKFLQQYSIKEFSSKRVEKGFLKKNWSNRN